MHRNILGYVFKISSETWKDVLNSWYPGPDDFHESLKDAELSFEKAIENGTYSKRAKPSYYKVKLERIVR